ncbi:hypothetical protein DY023_02830 [Microbacterium bovistercoris]|uniref:Glycosyltransferase RgtA/B/C/D-like domain-containing protein n=1 Tax=Microbacterium bovistercoris TaxID=2293570 RepID=A0A371NWS0_9MICO|nr:DUF6541 family protein [Microbacterium bovistercoris]REJ07593.1 hypothetical protein DY023_02830 [Microbacterium bovistercoris]
MIVGWLAVVPALLVTLILVFLPGLIALRGVGMRGLALVAFAPLLSVAMIAVAAILLGLVGVAWSPLSLGSVLLVLVLVGLLLGRLLGHPTPEPPGPAGDEGRWLLPVGLAIGIVLGAWRLIAYVQDPAGISQTNDAVFHMNAIRFILDAADASSLHVSAVIGGSGFYPAAWHAVVSTVVAITGGQIALAANAFTIVIGAVIWPLGLAWLTRCITGSRRIAALAAVLSPALQLFPLLMFQWGVLFPNALSVAMLPAACAVVMSLHVWNGNDRPVASWVRGVLLIAVAVAALALAQPAALPVWGLICSVWFTDLMLRVRRAAVLPARVAIIIGVWLLLGFMWYALAQGTGGSHWPQFQGKFESLAVAVLNGQLRIPFAWGISILMLVGLVVAILTPKLRWLAATWLCLTVLYVLVASVGMPLVRNVLLAPWYADPYRLAAFAPIAVIPLAAIGLDRVVGMIVARLPRAAVIRSWTAVGVATAGVLLVVMLRPVPMPAFLEGTFDAESRYLTAADTYLSTDERALLESLGEYVEPGERVIANPSTGAGFGYMLSGVDVYPHTWSPPRTAAWDLIAERLRDVGEDPEVCAALKSFGQPRYVLDFGPGEDAPGRYLMPGMTDFADQPGFELVTERGDVSLWRITACED